MSIVQKVLSQIHIGSPIRHQNLTMFPLMSNIPNHADYLTLDEAMSEHICRVSEVSESGNVAELFFENLGKDPILLLDGEELEGAKQNRVLNLTILCAGELKINIPVSCVEQGRWRYRSSTFKSAGRTLYSRARAAKMRSVSESMGREGSRHSDQGEVWDQISSKMSRMSAYSDTGASEAIYEFGKTRTQSYVEAMGVVPGQVGGVFAIENEIVGIELLDAPMTYAKVSAKLAESFALDALDVETDSAERLDVPRIDAGSVSAFLELLSKKKERRFKSIGLGDDIRIEAGDVLGAGLEVEGRVVHLSLLRSARGARRSPRRSSADLPI